MNPEVASLARLARTVAHLEPAQALHRARVQVQRKVVTARPEAFARRWTVQPQGQVGLPAGFTAVDSIVAADRWDIDEVDAGTFTFLGETRSLGNPVRWDPADASQLWLFHHHYWEWAWGLAAHPERDRARSILLSQWRSWSQQCTFGRWNAWAPYPVSLRAWVMVNTFEHLVAGTDLEASFVADMGLHAGFLRRHLELDIGGNHVIKNLKALYGLGVFLGDDRLIELATRHLLPELEIQVLSDGGHYELSPSYHCQVLGDLVDIAGLLAADGRPALTELDGAIARMQRWIGLMRLPDGTVPLFNDSEPVAPRTFELIGAGPSPTDDLTVLPGSGYVIVRRGPVHVVADVGQPGPSSPPGHIHADCLSFAMSIDDRPVVVDTGTSEYGSGPRRQHERSTAAHNTVEIDDHDQTEVWGAFRAGRRARATLERAERVGEEVVVTASHDGYRFLPGSPLHRRTWRITARSVSITDEVVGSGRHQLTSRIHFADTAVAAASDIAPTESGSMRLSADAAADPTVAGTEPGLVSVTISAPHGVDEMATGTGPEQPTWRSAEVARGFGVLVPAAVASHTVVAELPVTFTTTVELRTTPADRTDGDTEACSHPQVPGRSKEHG